MCFPRRLIIDSYVSMGVRGHGDPLAHPSAISFPICARIREKTQEERKRIRREQRSKAPWYSLYISPLAYSISMNSVLVSQSQKWL